MFQTDPNIIFFFLFLRNLVGLSVYFDQIKHLTTGRSGDSQMFGCSGSAGYLQCLMCHAVHH